MTAKIIAFPSHARVRLVPVDEDDMDLPLPVRQLLEIMEETERRFGAVDAFIGMDPREHLRICAPHLA